MLVLGQSDLSKGRSESIITKQDTKFFGHRSSIGLHGSQSSFFSGIKFQFSKIAFTEMFPPLMYAHSLCSAVMRKVKAHNIQFLAFLFLQRYFTVAAPLLINP